MATVKKSNRAGKTNGKARRRITEADIERKYGSSKNPVVQAALKARREYVASGGKNLSLKQINAEVRRMRGDTIRSR